jgi:hypothetical protein
MTDIQVLKGLLERHKPYLVDMEREVDRVMAMTGYGEVSCSLIIRHGKVYSWDVGGWVKSISPEVKKID